MNALNSLKWGNFLSDFIFISIIKFLLTSKMFPNTLTFKIRK